VLAAAGLVAYAGLALSFQGVPRALERRVFQQINSAPEWPWLRIPQQLGTPWVLPASSAALWVAGRRGAAVAAAFALPLEKGLEVATKKLTRRPRPVHCLPTELRDDAPLDGESFPSGHAALATCAAVLLAPELPRTARPVLLLSVAATAWGRVHQGAHHPADAVGGALLGAAVALLALELTDAVAGALGTVLAPARGL
jgi:membrane-associated phospholipid phosphatase